MRKPAIIGGTGLDQLPGFSSATLSSIDTPYGTPSAPLRIGQYAGQEICFLARHGETHEFAPHEVNYRANIWALKEIGVTDIVAVAAVGGIHPESGPGQLTIPDQLIDYTWGRAHSFSEPGRVLHVDFTEPYDQALRLELIETAAENGLSVLKHGVYGATQGPRLETAAEIRRLSQDGCDVVGMTGMPEAGLARELSLRYACIAVTVNWAAGLATDNSGIHDDIERYLVSGMQAGQRLLTCWLESL